MKDFQSVHPAEKETKLGFGLPKSGQIGIHAKERQFLQQKVADCEKRELIQERPLRLSRCHGIEIIMQIYNLHLRPEHSPRLDRYAPALP